MPKLNLESSQRCEPQIEQAYSPPKKGELWIFAEQPVLIMRTDASASIGMFGGPGLIWVMYPSGNKGMFGATAWRNHVEDKNAWKMA